MLLGSLVWRRLLACPQLDLPSRSLSTSVHRFKTKGTTKESDDRAEEVSDGFVLDDIGKLPNRLPKAMRVKLGKVCFKMREWGKTGKQEKVLDVIMNVHRLKLLPDIPTFNQAIKSLGLKKEYVVKAFAVFNKMKKEGYTADDTTFTSLFSMCAKHAPHHYEQLSRLHKYLVEHKIKVNVIVANAAIMAFAMHGDSTTAFKIYKEMFEKDVTEPVSEDVLTPGMVLSSARPDFGLDQELQFEFKPFSECKPDWFTYLALLKAAGRDCPLKLYMPTLYVVKNLKRLQEAWTYDKRRERALRLINSAWEDLEESDAKPNVELYGALLQGYRDGGWVDFLEVPADFRDVQKHYLIKQREKDPRYDASREVLGMFGRKPVSEEVTGDEEFDEDKMEEEIEDEEEVKTELTVEQREKLAKEVLPFGGWKQVLEQMRWHGVQPTINHFILIWQCLVTGEEKKRFLNLPDSETREGRRKVRQNILNLDATELLTAMQQHYVPPDRVFLANIIRAQAKAANFEGALKSLEAAEPMGIRIDLYLFTELAASCYRQEHGDEVLLMMQEHNVFPNADFFHALLQAAARHSRFTWMRSILQEMKAVGISPAMKTLVFLDKVRCGTHWWNNADRNIFVKYSKEMHGFSGFYSIWKKQMANGDTSPIEVDSETEDYFRNDRDDLNDDPLVVYTPKRKSEADNTNTLGHSVDKAFQLQAGDQFASVQKKRERTRKEDDDVFAILDRKRERRPRQMRSSSRKQR